MSPFGGGNRSVRSQGSDGGGAADDDEGVSDAEVLTAAMAGGIDDSSTRDGIDGSKEFSSSGMVGGLHSFAPEAGSSHDAHDDDAHDGDAHDGNAHSEMEGKA